jgi:hypothetical protein
MAVAYQKSAVANNAVAGLAEARQEDKQPLLEERRNGTVEISRLGEVPKPLDDHSGASGVDMTVNLTERAAAYRKTGWSRFDPEAPPLSVDQIRKERELYRRSSAA